VSCDCSASHELEYSNRMVSLTSTRSSFTSTRLGFGGSGAGSSGSGAFAEIRTGLGSVRITVFEHALPSSAIPIHAQVRAMAPIVGWIAACAPDGRFLCVRRDRSSDSDSHAQTHLARPRGARRVHGKW